MLDWIQSLMSYPGIAFLMFLENVFPPLPSELIMPLAGFTAGQGKITLWGAIFAGAFGSVVGQLPLYYLGKLVGQERLKAWADKYGAWLTVSGDDITKAENWFNKHGEKVVLFGRLVPGVRSLLSIPAGLADMNLAKFLTYSFLGTGTWAAALGFAGYLLRSQYKIVEKWIGPIAYVVLGGFIIYVAYSVIKRKKEKANA